MKMTNEIRIKMAEAEGYIHIQEGDESTSYWRTPEKYTWREQSEPPTYDNDNDLCRFIRGMSEEDKKAFNMFACSLSYADPYPYTWELTVEQKQEAIVRAKGWE